jgi:hypothetical protein
MHISRKPLLAGLLPVVAALALTVLPALASAAAPYWYINGTKLGTPVPASSNVKGYTIAGFPLALNWTISGLTAHVSCDLSYFGKVWNDSHGQIDTATFPTCVATAPTNCTVTMIGDTSTPWGSTAGGTVSTGYTDTLSGLVWRMTYGSTPNHTCALASYGTLILTGNLTPTFTNRTGCAGDGSDESFVTFSTTTGTLTVKDAAGATRGSATIAGDVYECGTNDGGSTWSLLDLLDS